MSLADQLKGLRERADNAQDYRRPLDERGLPEGAGSRRKSGRPVGYPGHSSRAPDRETR
jgi:hypothetical protein